MTTPIEADSLKPCPFCGNESVYRKHDDGLSWVECPECRSTGPAGTRYTDEYEVTWNTRADTESRAHADMLAAALANAIATIQGETARSTWEESGTHWALLEALSEHKALRGR